MWCVTCGRTSQETLIYPLPRALSPDLGACSRHVRAGMSREADRQLAQAPYSWVPVRQPRCHHCQEPMLYTDPRHGHPLWCHTCERERAAIADRGQA